jgi:hypothetical protein
MLVVENDKINLQKATIEIIKCLLGKPKLKHQLTWHPLDKQIKQESDEEVSSQRPRKKKKKKTTHNGFVDNFGLQFKLWWRKIRI